MIGRTTGCGIQPLALADGEMLEEFDGKIIGKNNTFN